MALSRSAVRLSPVAWVSASTRLMAWSNSMKPWTAVTPMARLSAPMPMPRLVAAWPRRWLLSTGLSRLVASCSACLLAACMRAV